MAGVRAKRHCACNAYALLDSCWVVTAADRCMNWPNCLSTDTLTILKAVSVLLRCGVDTHAILSAIPK